MCCQKSDKVSTNNLWEKAWHTRDNCRNSKLHREKHTVGDYAVWHPHLHALVADGLFLESGYFFVMLKVDLRPLQELFRAYVLKMLKKEGLIDDNFIKMFSLLSWKS